jgi:hypothetical protein
LPPLGPAGFPIWQDFLLASGLVILWTNLLVQRRRLPPDIAWSDEGGGRSCHVGYHAALLQRALDRVESSGPYVELGTVADAVHRLDPAFDHVAAGYDTFAAFVVGSGWAVRHVRALYKALPRGLGG